MSIIDTAEVIDLTINSSPSRNGSKELPIDPLEAIRTLSGTTHDVPHEVLQDTPNKPGGSKRKRNKKRQSESKPNTQDMTDGQSPPLAEEDGLFFVDLAPIPLAAQPSTIELPKEEEKARKLLLPAHVSVFGSTPVEILAPTTSLEDDSIQFLDYDDGKVCPRRACEDSLC
jgi:protein AIR1/2